jgi:hypothetical protein
MPKTKKTRSIEVTKLGAIRYHVAEIPEKGGVVVGRGRNGTGKSTLLAGIDKMTGRAADLPGPTDGHDRGSMEGLGVTLTFGRSTRRAGELEIIALDAKLSIADLVDPKIADPDAADAKRMKSLLAILRVQAELDQWLISVPDGADPLESARAAAVNDFIRSTHADAEDVLTFAGKLKRWYHAAALAHEKSADELEKQLGAYASDPRVTAADDPPTPPSDAALAAELTEANQATIELAKRFGRAQDVAKLRDTIEGLKGALCNETATAARLQGIATQRQELLDALAKLDAEQESLTDSYAKSVAARAEIAKLEKKLETSTAPTQAEIDAANEREKAAREAFAAANDLRGVIKARAMAKELRSKIDLAKQEPKVYRDFAADTDRLLGKMVGNRVKGLSYEDGRMLYKHPDRGVIRFAELSPGERSLIAASALIDGLGENGLATLPQEFWEGLDPQNRDKVAAMAEANGVVLFTAECSADPELHTEIYEPGVQPV